MGSGESGLKVRTWESRGSRYSPDWGGFDGPLLGKFERLWVQVQDGCPLKIPAKVPRRAGLWWLSCCFHNSPGSFGSCLWLCWVNRCSGAASFQSPRPDQMSAIGAGGWWRSRSHPQIHAHALAPLEARWGSSRARTRGSLSASAGGCPLGFVALGELLHLSLSVST